MRRFCSAARLPPFQPALALLAAGVIVAGVKDVSATEAEVLRTAAQVRALSITEAARRLPVNLEGVITVVGPRNVIYLQDRTGGVLVTTPSDGPVSEPGDQVALDGVAIFGQLVPRVDSSTLRKLGTGRLPEPVRLSSDDLATGRRLSEWVQIEGVVRSAAIGTEGRATLHVDLGARMVESMLIRAGLEECLPLVDARVRIRGVVAGYVNQRRQMAELYVRANSLADVEIVEPPVSDAFDLPVTRATDVMLFSPRGHTGHRVKLRGALLGQRPGAELYLRDETLAVVAQVRQPEVLAPGDVVEVVGFPVMGPVNPRLQDAIFRRVAAGTAPTARETNMEKLWQGYLDGELVALRGELIDMTAAGPEMVLMIESGGAVLRARLNSPSTGLAPWQRGSQVRVTGICRVERAQKPSEGIRVVAGDVELWLRDSSDVAILRPPPWWTTERLWITAGAAVTAALGALAWGALLRRRVQIQTGIIRDQIQRESVAEERQRIAREFHDTLEQELVGLAIRLDHLRLKVTDSSVGPLAHALQRLARRLQDEARHFIWNLHERRWENIPLSQALADAVAERHDGDRVGIRFNTEGDARRLPDVASHHLMRIAQEAVANAIQHAAATGVDVTLRYAEAAVVIVVRDDGCGFDPQEVIGRRAGHFGLSGMSERARRIGATLSLRSQPGSGTTVEVQFPHRAAGPSS